MLDKHDHYVKPMTTYYFDSVVQICKSCLYDYEEGVPWTTFGQAKCVQYFMDVGKKIRKKSCVNYRVRITQFT